MPGEDWGDVTPEYDFTLPTTEDDSAAVEGVVGKLASSLKKEKGSPKKK